VLKYPFVIK